MVSKSDSIEQTGALLQALFLQPTRMTQSLADVLKAIEAGKTNIVVELPWAEMRPEGHYERHQVILLRIAHGRAYFDNPLKTAALPGSEIGGVGKGPLRRLEANGEESMDLAFFITLFENGGKALLR